ncbi:MAG: type 4a pilus biogenesis protein PilO [Acidiferrobacterales bacterium]|nr:type 4a pilus biogenesis protein PilO [Acidiferrobacterales bacterium]
MIAVIGIAILFGGYKYLIEPEQLGLEKLERTEVQLKDTFLIKKELVVNLPAYREQMIEIQDRFGVVLKQLPDKTEVPALLIDISQAGLSRGLIFNQFKPGDPRTEEFYITLPISVKVTGGYHQFAEFISDLASLPRIVTLGNMKIVRSSEEALSMSAQLFTYQYLDDLSLDAPDSQSQKERVKG